MIFDIGGYDIGAPYGRIFQIGIPSQPTPVELLADRGNFGMVYGGQREFVDRLLGGFDENLLAVTQQHLSLDDDARDGLRQELREKCSAHLPYAFLPLQDCVDLAIFCIRATTSIQSWYVGIRGVGGAIDVATITRTDGFVSIQEKTIVGERQ
jgi:hypothetical protein